jgi:ATP-dependent helicase/nuclease subunit B
LALQFILGAPGTGKTTHCLKELERHFSGDAPLYYLVPEQFSLQSERLLLSGRDAVVRVQVLSFNRLAYRLFSVLGGPPGRMADDLAKAMLLRKVLFENADALMYYQSAHDKHGFVESLAHTLTELNHYRITAEDLLARADQGEGASPVADANPTLTAKLSDLALILTKYREAVTGRYLLTDDRLELLAQRLEAVTSGLPLLEKAVIFVDGFSGFTPQERLVLIHIMKHAAYMGITLTTRDLPDFTDPLCAAPGNTQEKLTRQALQAGLELLPPIYMKKNFRHARNEGLAFFVQNFTVHTHKAEGASPSFTAEIKEAIELIPAADPYAAVLSAASRIYEWVHKRAYRFRDIAILCGDRARYEKILRLAFDRLNIPLFVDTETDILSHPLTELIRAAFDIVNRNYHYEGVFRFLKTGLAGLPRDDVDILENYALAHGIAGYRWNYEMQNPVAEAARRHLMQTMDIFKKSGRRDTVLGYSRRVFDLLYALDVPDTLARLFDEYMASGDPETARMHKQIWLKICEIFDKLVEILGETPVTMQEFAALLDAGLARAGLGRIPPTLDQVILGDMGRSRYPEIKAMLVLGANEGVLPPLPAAPGLFTDDERELLRNSALELAPEITDRVNEQYYALYCALSQPAEVVAFIYAEGEPNGMVLRPSPVLRTIRTLFPKLLPKITPPLHEYTPIAFVKNDHPAPALSQQSVNQLFGATVYTAASRLEAYACCPFAYYMTYLLKAKPRKQYEVLPADLGNLFHAVVALYAQQEGWQPRTPSQISDIVTDLVARITPETAAFHGSARNRYILEKARRVCTASLWALTGQIKQDVYNPAYSEIDLPPMPPVPVGNGKNLVLSGRIDRVDLHTDEDGDTYVKIIDYKSGRARFNPNEVRQGTQLQLMLYMNAMLNSPDLQHKNPRAGGVFYFPVDDPIIKTDTLLDDTTREASLLKAFKMSGLAATDLPEFTQLSRDADEKMKELTRNLTNGKIAPKPCPQGGKSPCDYCGFGAICKYKL